MAEFSGIPPVGINSIVRPAPVSPPPAIPDVEPGLKGGGLSGQMMSNARQQVPGRARPHDQVTPDPRRRGADPAQLAGPSPAFQASVLELELDLQNTIARVEAARGRRESEIAGVTTGQARAPDDNAPGADTRDATAKEPVKAGRNAVPEGPPDAEPQPSADGAQKTGDDAALLPETG
jgi:hypothetical protein